MPNKKNSPGIFYRAFQYIKDNAGIGYSLGLLLLVPAAFFANNYIANTNYEKAIDTITQRKAVLAENIFSKFIYGRLSDAVGLQLLVDDIIQNNNEIVGLSVLRPSNKQGEFEVVASGNSEDIGRIKKEDVQNILAWSHLKCYTIINSC